VSVADVVSSVKELMKVPFWVFSSNEHRHGHLWLHLRVVVLDAVVEAVM